MGDAGADLLAGWKDILFPLAQHDLYSAGAVAVVLFAGAASVATLARTSITDRWFLASLAGFVTVSWTMLQLPDMLRERYVGTPDEACARFARTVEHGTDGYELKGFPERVKLDEPYVDRSGESIRYATEVMLYNREVWGEAHHLCRFPYDEATRQWEAVVMARKKEQGEASERARLEFGDRPLGRIMVGLPGMASTMGADDAGSGSSQADEYRGGNVGERDASEGGAEFRRHPDNPKQLPLKPFVEPD